MNEYLSYKVYYKVVGNENYNDIAEVCVDVVYVASFIW